jgi:hypothetical protein
MLSRAREMAFIIESASLLEHWQVSLPTVGLRMRRPDETVKDHDDN